MIPDVDFLRKLTRHHLGAQTATMRTGSETFFRYFPVSQIDEDWGFYVTIAGYVRIAAGEPYPPTGHPENYVLSWDQGRILHEFQFHYIPSHSGIFHLKTAGHSQIEAGSVYILLPEEWHRYRPTP